MEPHTQAVDYVSVQRAPRQSVAWGIIVWISTRIPPCGKGESWCKVCLDESKWTSWYQMNEWGTDGNHRVRPDHPFAFIFYPRSPHIRGGSWSPCARFREANCSIFYSILFYTDIYACGFYVFVLSYPLAGILEVAFIGDFLACGGAVYCDPHQSLVLRQLDSPVRSHVWGR